MTPFIVAASLALFTMDATAATSTSQPAMTKAPAADSARTSDADDQDKVICKRQVITGSRFEKRVCMTRAEWGEQARKTEEFERRLNQNPNGVATGGPMGAN